MITCKKTGLTIYPIEFVEIEELRRLRNDEGVWLMLANPFMVNEVEQEKWFKDQAHDKTKQYFGIHDQNNLVGCVWYTEWDRINSSARVGIILHDNFRGMGFGTDAFTTFCDYLQQQMHMHRLWLLVKEDNALAINLFMKLKFETEGTQREALYRLGKYFNYLMMARII